MKFFSLDILHEGFLAVELMLEHFFSDNFFSVQYGCAQHIYFSSLPFIYLMEYYLKLSFYDIYAILKFSYYVEELLKP